MIQDRVILGATYARNRSSNQLISYVIPSTTGFTGITQNLPATIQNTSWEFTLNTTNIKKKDFLWTSGLNLTIPWNKLISFPNIEKQSMLPVILASLLVNRLLSSRPIKMQVSIRQPAITWYMTRMATQLPVRISSKTEPF
ncbi:hypothetical protein [Paraflavitalea speifideaquila]|uniref:hypothetical protein n=1 Tax=Paraflavitalea speifideaquila TaxID=3076558 RepID=UPI0028EE1C5C|nr:hypothetical protein [Paraflavitalea speifideiaquila]